MNKQLKRYLLLVFILIGAGINVGISQTFIKIKNQDGTEKLISSGTLNKITFSGENLVCHYTTNNTESLLLSSIRRIEFNRTTTSQKQIVNQTTLSVFPNPSTDYIEINNIPDNKFQVYLYTINGKLIGSYQLFKGNTQINIRNLPNGVYFVKTGISTLKFVKQ